MSDQNRIQGRQGEHRATMLFLWMGFEVKQIEVDDGIDLGISKADGYGIDVQVKTAKRPVLTGRQLMRAIGRLNERRPQLLVHLDPVYPHDPVAWVLLSRWLERVPALATDAERGEASFSPPADLWTPFPKDVREMPMGLMDVLRTEVRHLINQVADTPTLYPLGVIRVLQRPEVLVHAEAPERLVKEARLQLDQDPDRFPGSSHPELVRMLEHALEIEVVSQADPKDRAHAQEAVRRFFHAIELVKRGDTRAALQALPDYNKVELSVWRYLLANTATARRMIDLAVAQAKDLSPGRVRALMGILSGKAAADDTGEGSFVWHKLDELHPLRVLDGLQPAHPVHGLKELGDRLGGRTGLNRTAFDVFRQWTFSMLEATGDPAYAQHYLQLFDKVGPQSYDWHLLNWREYYGVDHDTLKELIGKRWTDPSARHSRVSGLHEFWLQCLSDPPPGTPRSEG